MARRRRGVVGSVISGVDTILGQLASFFRLGQYGAVSPGEPESAGRPRLRTPREIIRELRGRHMLPRSQEGRRWSWSYICIWTDAQTGDRIGAYREVIETPAGTSYQRASAEARRDAVANIPGCVNRVINMGREVRMTCRRVGRILELPTQ